MKTLTLTRLLQRLEETVLAQVRGEDPRVVELMTNFIRHAHAFVRETRLSQEEWAAAIDFLIRVGRTC